MTDTPNNTLDNDALHEVIQTIDKSLDDCFDKAKQLAQEFTDFRLLSLNDRPTMDMLWLMLYVNRRPDGTIYIYWRRARNSYVRDGAKRVISDHLPKPRSGPYRPSTLKSHSPPWSHETVLDTEVRAQHIRESAAALNTARRALLAVTPDLSDQESED
ncbi:MAG: conjugative transfer protein MobI(A/C) [Salinisphaeraceae bacterium]